MKTVMRTRNDFAALLGELALTGMAVEVGVACGYFSHHLLANWAGTCVQVDPWKIINSPGFSGHGEGTNEGQEKRYQQILKDADRYDGRCIPMRLTSAEAARSFSNETFCFVYLDAAHNYDSIKQDIELWYPKVKRSGLLSGHDYLQGIVDGVDYGVKQAVGEFSAKLGLTVNVTQETEYPSWWIVKP